MVNLLNIDVVNKLVNLPTKKHAIQFDDVDSQYGLHDYTVSAQFRSIGTSKWSHNFSKVFFNKFEDKKAHSLLLKDEQGQTVQLPINFVWKTPAFSQTIPMATIVDFILQDERGEVMWSFSHLIKIVPTHPMSNYDHPDDSKYYSLSFSDNERGQTNFVIVISESSQLCLIAMAELKLECSFINRWFGTRWPDSKR